MKFIGQFIQNFIARFRDSVFFESVENADSDTDKFLVIGAEGKLKYRTGTQVLSDIGASTSTGDITAVTITTDSGGGSAASDTEGSADFSILGANGVGVTNSGTTITAAAVPGEIDHDSLLNFVANEHIDWTASSAGTIHSTNIPTLNQDTTGQAGTVATIAGLAPNTATTAASQPNITSLGTLSALTIGGDLTVNGDTITFESTAANDPTVTIQNTTDDTNSPRLRFFKRREDGGTLQVGEDGDGVGEILFNSYDDNSGTPGGTNYAKIEGFIDDATNGQESGQLKLQVASHDGGVETGLQLTGGDVDAEVDVTIGNGTASVTTIAGSLRPKGQIHISHHSFTADIDTTKNYVGLADADSESTGTTGIDMPLIFPMASKLLQVTMRSNKNLSGLTYTFRLETQATGVGFGTGPTVVGTQSGTGPTQPGHAVYDFTTSLDSGDNIVDAFDAAYLSIQSSGSTANTKYYITCVWETDLSGY